MAKILVSMPDKFLKQVDELADVEHRSRSELIRESLRVYLNRNRVQNKERAASQASELESLLD